MYESIKGDSLNTAILKGKAGIRCTSPDYLPIIGPIVDEDLFNEQYAKLRKDAKSIFKTIPVYLPGLYVNTAHGSRGLVTAPLSGEILASLICNETLPISNRLIKNLLPNRFLARKLIKSQSY